MEQVRRDVIIELHRLGKDSPEIREITKYPKATVNAVIKRYKEKGTTKRKASKKRKDTVMNEDLKQFVKTVWHPSMSLSSLARQTNLSVTTMCRAIKGETAPTKTTARRNNQKVQVKQEADQGDGSQPGVKKGKLGEFPCGTCKKVLRFRQSLEDHMRTHTGEKPFACPYCDYGGGSSSLLAHHKRQRHKEERAREEREKEKKRDEMVQRYLLKAAEYKEEKD